MPPVGDGWESFTREQLQDIVDKRASLPYRIGEPKWIRTFQPRPGIAEHFRVGRTFLVGDSAHCVVPLGGQGLNLGIQDAFNLGWKLGGVVRGRLPEPVLDTYEAERRRAAQQVTAVVDKQILAAKQVKPLPSLVRDAVVSAARVTGMLERVAAPLIGGVGLAYGKPQRRSLLRPQPRRVRPGRRVPFHSTTGPRTGRGLLDPERFTGRLRNNDEMPDVDDVMRRLVKENLRTFEGKALRLQLLESVGGEGLGAGLGRVHGGLVDVRGLGRAGHRPAGRALGADGQLVGGVEGGGAELGDPRRGAAGDRRRRRS